MKATPGFTAEGSVKSTKDYFASIDINFGFPQTITIARRGFWYCAALAAGTGAAAGACGTANPLACAAAGAGATAFLRDCT